MVHIATSGWTYKDWAGVFYPPEVKAAGRLAYYATIFDSVEVNATFYRFPTQAMLDAWNRTLKPDFHLVVKGTRVVTHLKKLVDCQEPLAAFWDRVKLLRTLRVILWQLPPSLPKNVERLKRFLESLPGKNKVRHAVEFRDASWWDDEVADLLAHHRTAFVAISHPSLPNTVYPTTDFLYVRFHGLGKQLYLYDYSERELREWANRLTPYLPGRTLYAFFNNDYEAHAPHNALRLRELLQKDT